MARPLREELFFAASLSEDTHKRVFFLVVEPLRSGYPLSLVLGSTFFFIAWKWSQMDIKCIKKMSVKIWEFIFSNT